MLPERRISDEALAVLKAVLERPMDGYTVMSRTGLEPVALVRAAEELQKAELILVKGRLAESEVGGTFLLVPPGAKGMANYMLGLPPGP